MDLATFVRSLQDAAPGAVIESAPTIDGQSTVYVSRDDLRACLASLQAQTHPDLEVIVVDNGSTDGSAEMTASEFPAYTLVRQRENLGFAEGCNRGIAAAADRGRWRACSCRSRGRWRAAATLRRSARSRWSRSRCP